MTSRITYFCHYRHQFVFFNPFSCKRFHPPKYWFFEVQAKIWILNNIFLIWNSVSNGMGQCNFFGTKGQKVLPRDGTGQDSLLKSCFRTSFSCFRTSFFCLCVPFGKWFCPRTYRDRGVCPGTKGQQDVSLDVPSHWISNLKWEKSWYFLDKTWKFRSWCYLALAAVFYLSRWFVG